MARALKVELTTQQQKELQHLREHAGKPYIRVRAAAILKVAAGQAVRQVAEHGLLKRVNPETESRLDRTLFARRQSRIARESRTRA